MVDSPGSARRAPLCNASSSDAAQDYRGAVGGDLYDVVGGV